MPHACLIPHPQENRVLLHDTADGWTLPQHDLTAAEDINRAMRAQTGINVVVLRVAEQGIDHNIYAMDSYGTSTRIPDGYQWIDRKELSRLKLADNRQRSAILNWLDEVDGTTQVPPLRAPWARRGWYVNAVKWIDAQSRLSSPIFQVQVRPSGCILKTGDLVFKAAPQPFLHEPALVQALAGIAPALIPEVVAIESERGWLLQRDAGTMLRDKITAIDDLSRVAALMVAFGELQRGTETRLADLIGLGVPDRRLSTLPDLFEDLVTGRELVIGDPPDGIPRQEMQRLRAFRPEVEAMCDALGAVGIPATIHHDDFGTQNILSSGDNYAVVDWAESAAAQPFFSLVMMLRYLGATLRIPADDPRLVAIRDAYLGVWTDIAPRATLVEAYQATQRLHKLIRTLTWHQFLAHQEPAVRAREAGTVEYWLREFLGTVSLAE